MTVARSRDPQDFSSYSVGSVLSGLCFSSTDTTSSVALQDPIRGHSSDCDTKLAQEGLVLGYTPASGRLPLASFGSPGSSVSRPNLPSCFSIAGFDGLAVEAQILKDGGLAALVIL